MAKIQADDCSYSSGEGGGYVAYVGCYTLPGQADPFEGSLGGIPHDRSKVGEGIRLLRVSRDGKLDLEDEVVAKVTNPSYLHLSPPDDPRYLFAVSEVERGTVHAFSLPPPRKPCAGVDDVAGEHARVGGDIPTTDDGVASAYSAHVVADEESGLLFVSNYGADPDGGSVSTFHLGLDDGASSDPITPTTPRQVVRNGGKCGPDGNRQLSSHPHCCAVVVGDEDGSKKFVCVTDLGTDEIITHELSSADNGGAGGDAVMREVSRFSAPAGSGPRSISINPADPTVAAVSLEMAAQVLLVRIDRSSGRISAIGEPVSVIPDGWPDDGDEDDEMRRFNGGKWASDAVWGADGRHLYAAARLHDSISVFRLEGGGGGGTAGSEPKLKLVQRVPSGGKTPRCLCLSPDRGDLLLVANQHSHCICSFRINHDSGGGDEDGKLTAVDEVAVPLPSCVKMMTIDR